MKRIFWLAVALPAVILTLNDECGYPVQHAAGYLRAYWTRRNGAAIFLVSHGHTIVHPELARFFEVPIALPLPEDFSYIP